MLTTSSIRPGLTDAPLFSENIYGYKEPKVKLFYSAARLNAFLSFSHNGDVTALDDRDGLVGIRLNSAAWRLADVLVWIGCRTRHQTSPLIK